MPRDPRHLFLLTATDAMPGEIGSMLVRASTIKEARELASIETASTEPWNNARRTEYKRLASDVAGRAEVVLVATR